MADTTAQIGESSSMAQARCSGHIRAEPMVTSPCGRCDHVYTYQAGTPWACVARMVDEHWRVCPNSISATLLRLRERSQNVDRPYSERSPQRSPSKSPSPDVVIPAAVPTESRKKNMMDEATRRKKLESDEWTAEVTPKSVKCVACGRTVSLDKRSRYYPGLWLKHRGKCMEIKRLGVMRRTEGEPSTILGGESKEGGQSSRTRSESPLGSTDNRSASAEETRLIHGQAAGSGSGSWSGYRYGAGAPPQISHAYSKSESVEGSASHENSRHRGLVTAQNKQSVSSRGFRRIHPYPVRRERPVDEQGERAYWAHAPFATDEREPEEHQRRPTYRNATQWELGTSFRDSFVLLSDDINSPLEKVAPSS